MIILRYIFFSILICWIVYETFCFNEHRMEKDNERLEFLNNLARQICQINLSDLFLSILLMKSP